MNKITYYVLLDKKKSPGVYGKVKGICDALGEKNYKCELMLLKPCGLKGLIQLCYFIIKDKSDIIFLRYTPKLAFFYFFYFFIFKPKNKKVVCDVPTPLVNLRKELDKNLFQKFFFNIQYFLLFPISFVGFDLILNYAEESSYISFFSKKKRINVSNSVKTTDLPSIPKKDLRYNFIAVGTVAKWHGWDIFIEALNDYQINNSDISKFDLLIVGDGPDLLYLKNLVSKYNLSNNVKFTGLVNFNEIQSLYDDRTIGLGSFGWHRVGIKSASPIKSREYLINGLNIVYSTFDEQIESCETAFCIQGKADKKSLYNYLVNIEKIFKLNPSYSRNFAINNCGFDTYVDTILCKLK